MTRSSPLGISFLVLIALGCSGTNGAAGANGSNGEDGSACHVTDNGDGTAIVFCDDGTAATIHDGTDGTDGSDGADGKNGKAGKDGSDALSTEIIESYYCSGALESMTLGFSYDAVLFSSGDLFVAGSVTDPAGSGSDTKFYAPTQNGYETAPVYVVLDVDGTADGGWFTLSLDRSSLQTKIDYRGSDAGPLMDSWTMDPALCVHNLY